ncbi:unnamed protein product (mitochondrion) [Plasmodiophora brassicae]|uniref:Ubiquinone biosynthesis protein n=1 Tax=Plasmodiophora brassicae TaxID=37360 RepID=A0A0G4IYL3_PLABS|nr:hypothetical protein PBRA_001512 [Plasmodiophora brassicae]SPQ94039.1 unnamed protein product [Plasmodiophora brassicae]
MWAVRMSCRRLSTTSFAAGDTAAVRRLLEESVKYVPRLGFTTSALSAGAVGLGMSPMAHGMCTRGAIELVEHVMEAARNQMVDVVKTNCDPATSSKLDVLRLAIRTRLEGIIPYVNRWAEAMALGAMPHNAIQTSQNLACLVDDIAHLAFDETVNVDWYAMRAGIGAVYVSTELFMLQDRSQDYADTWAFLDRRLQEFSTYATVPDQVLEHTRSAAALAWSGVTSLVSTFLPASSARHADTIHQPPPVQPEPNPQQP